MRIKRYRSELNVLMDSVIITGSSEAEVQEAADHIAGEEGVTHSMFLHPVYKTQFNEWLMVGEVTRNH